MLSGAASGYQDIEAVILAKLAKWSRRKLQPQIRIDPDRSDRWGRSCPRRVRALFVLSLYLGRSFIHRGKLWDRCDRIRKRFPYLLLDKSAYGVGPSPLQQACGSACFVKRQIGRECRQPDALFERVRELALQIPHPQRLVIGGLIDVVGKKALLRKRAADVDGVRHGRVRRRAHRVGQRTAVLRPGEDHRPQARKELFERVAADGRGGEQTAKQPIFGQDRDAVRSQQNICFETLRPSFPGTPDHGCDRRIERSCRDVRKGGEVAPSLARRLQDDVMQVLGDGTFA